MVNPFYLRDVFDQVVSLPASARAAYLDEACRHNDPVRQAVEQLLAAHDKAGSVFDTQASADTPCRGAEASHALRISLVAGVCLGPYRISAILGAGGMGEVYKAQDTRLHRTVAVKVLLSELTSDPEARQRLEREACAAAALTHPNICRLLDIGSQDGIDYLVMEFLEGETLAARLGRGALPHDEAVAYAIQTAAALDAAHRAGIVHRDLKPGNIMLTQSGATLLDFGLAKHLQPLTTGEPSQGLSQPATRGGMIFGTVQYMAPEQLEGKAADCRTDLFAFGAVLHEMLTGHRAFHGTNDASIIGSILHTDPPPPSSIDATIPAALDGVVHGCLAKEPAARWQTATDVHARLLAARDRIPDSDAHPRRDPRPATRKGAAAVLPVLGVVVVGVVGSLTWRWAAGPRSATKTGDPASIQRNVTRLTFDQGLHTDPALSPDGRFLAYASDRAGNFDVWVQQLSGGDPVQVTKSPDHDSQPSWSPDGSALAFRSERDNGGVYVIPALGGVERRLASFGVHPSWSPDGTEVRFQRESFLWGKRTGFYAATLNGERVRELLPDFTANGSWRWIEPHPDGRLSFLGFHKKFGYGFFTVSPDGTVTDSHLIDRVPSALSDMAHSGGQRFHWNSTGTALLLETEANNGVQNLWIVRVDSATLNWTSIERLTTGGADVEAAFSPDGARVVFSTQHVSERLWRFAFDHLRRRLGDGQPLTEEGAAGIGADMTPDGQSAVYHVLRPGMDPPTISVWLMDLAARRPLLLALNAEFPSWSPDRRRVAYTRFRPDAIDSRTGAEVRALAVRDVGGAERLISPWSTKSLEVSDWVRDGRAVLASTGPEIVAWPIEDPPAVRPSQIVLARRDGNLDQAEYSPNGRWLSFVSRQSINPELSLVGVASSAGLPDREWTAITPRHKWANLPRWAPDGKAIYFVTNGSGSLLNLWGSEFDPGRGEVIGKPFAVTEFNSPAFRLSSGMWSRMSVSNREVFLTMRTAAGSIWMLDNVGR
jgi:eukaryotic-like serine/threonine-protein kinase